ncbi:MAG: hypothetical protein IT577_22970 [Verrucomicrobiae bacterium]|nr:hypothetical protein [Verrucomicrobiae bacterium]
MSIVNRSWVRTALFVVAAWSAGDGPAAAQESPPLPGFSLSPFGQPPPAEGAAPPLATNAPMVSPAPAQPQAPDAPPPPQAAPAIAPAPVPAIDLRAQKKPEPARPPPPAAQAIIPVLTTGSRDGGGLSIPTLIRWAPRLSAQPTPLRVAISENIPGGTGKLLRSSAWMAAMVASLELNIPLADGTFEIEARGRIDGPSAGAAFATGLICLLQGVKFPSDLALTGSLAPDGSIGPVDGIPQKLAAAKAAGIRRVVVPACQPIAKDERGKDVTLSDRAREIGLEILFAGDVHQAYELATGRRVRPPDPPPAQPAYGKPVFDFLTRVCEEQIALYEKNRDAIERFLKQKNLRPAAKSLLAKVRADFDAGRRAFDAGKRYAALGYLKDANAAFSVLESLSKSGELTDAARTTWLQRGEDVQQKMTEALLRGRDKAGSLTTALVFAEEADWLFAATARISRATLSLEDVQRRIAATGPGKIRGSLRQEQDYFTILLIYACLYGEYQLGFQPLFDGLIKSTRARGDDADPSASRNWLPVLLQAHLANAQYFTAGSALLSPELRQQMLVDQRVAAFLELTRLAAEKWERLESAAPAQPRGFDELSGCLLWANAYCEAAVLQQKYVGLGGALDKNLEWQTLNRPTLQEMLRLAEARALAGIALADKARVDPSPLSLLHEKAAWLRDGPQDADRLESLRLFWRIALLGRLCVALSK